MTQLCNSVSALWSRYGRYLNECTWLYFDKALFMDTEVGLEFSYVTEYCSLCFSQPFKNVNIFFSLTGCRETGSRVNMPTPALDDSSFLSGRCSLLFCFVFFLGSWHVMKNFKLLLSFCPFRKEYSWLPLLWSSHNGKSNSITAKDKSSSPSGRNKVVEEKNKSIIYPLKGGRSWKQKWGNIQVNTNLWQVILSA